MKRLIATALAVACLAAPIPAFAAQAEETKTLDTVVVTAGRIEEKAKNVTQSMTVIPREEIEKNQYKDLGYMLRNYGMQVDIRESADSFSVVVMRGMRGPQFDGDVKSPILVLVDGRRIGTANISMIPMVGIERIEIIRGPASVQYGASAIGGVVNVITKRGGKDLKASAEVGYGSWETWKTQAGMSGSYGPVDFAGGVSWTAIGQDYKTGHGHRYKNTELNNRTSYTVNAGVTFLEEHRLGIAALGTESATAGQPSYLVQPDHTAKTDRGNHSVDFTYDGGYKDAGLQWKARYFTGRDRYRSYDDEDLYYFWPMPDAKTTIDTQGAQGQLSWTKGFLTLTGGFDWTNSDYRKSVDWYTTPGTGSGRSEYDNFGGFLLAKAGLFEDKLILSGGIRYDDYSLEYEGAEKTFDNVSPSVGLAWHALDWLTFRSNYGESYRIPGAMEVTGYRGGGMGNYHGNPNLKPEKGIGWDVGFEIDYKALNLGLTYFQTDYEDKIDDRPYGTGPDLQWYNISGRSQVRGLEGQAGLDVGAVFDWPFILRPYANITHLLKYENADHEKLQDISHTNLAYGVNFQYPSIGLEADLRVTYFGHRKENDFVNYTGELNTGGDTTVDFFIAKTIMNWEDAGTLSLKGAVYNMFDVEYSTTYGYPMPGRTFYVGLRYDY